MENRTLTSFDTTPAPPSSAPCDLAQLADQLKLLALNAAVETAATDPTALYMNPGLAALETALGGIEGVLSRRPLTAEADADLVREVGELSRSLAHTVSVLER
jgi:hypothetical protein